MGMDKGGSRGGAFFNLFDWNRKSRKKLPPNGSASQAGAAKLERNKNGVLREYEFHSNGNGDVADSRGETSSGGNRGNNCYCSGIVDADDGNGKKAPGVVARLMGLDFLPVSGSSDPCCTLSGECKPDCYQEGSLEHVFSERVDDMTPRNELCSCKTLDSKCRRVHASSLERFRTEILPRKSGKSIPTADYKLRSPIKSHCFSSSDDGSNIMEAAAKILDRRNQGYKGTELQSRALTYRPLRAGDTMECVAVPHRSSGLLEMSVVESNDVKQLGNSWCGSEGDSSFKTSALTSSLVNAKGKGKSISLAAQDKANTQAKKISTATNDAGSNRSIRKQLNSPRTNEDKRGSPSNLSSVLKQNNQKQNTLGSKDTLHVRLVGPRQVRDKSVARYDMPIKNKNNKLPVNHMSSSSKEGHKNGSSVKNTSTSQPQKTDAEGQNENKFSGNVLVNGNWKHVQHNFIVDNNPMQSEERRRDSLDVVSFTFRSSISKSTPATLPSDRRVEKGDGKSCTTGCSFQKGHVIDINNMGSSNVELEMITGDALKRLLEQKLRELTSEVTLSQNDFLEKVSATDEDYYSPSSNQGSASVNLSNWSPVHSSQEAKSMSRCSVSDDEPELLLPEQLCGVEACFSNESHGFTGCYLNSDGGKLDTLVCAEQLASPVCSEDKLFGEVETVTNLVPLDFVQNMDEGNEYGVRCSPKDQLMLHDWEVHYVTEILSACQLQVEDFMLDCALGSLDSLIFNNLEGKQINFNKDDSKDARWTRKVLFDCVGECVDSISTRHFRAGFRSWASGDALLHGELVGKIYEEISKWRSLGGWMVDELVERDMNSHLGRWVDFEIDSFKVGLEIEEEILSTMIDELVAELHA